MATRTFRTPTVTPLTWWRVDTASGSDSRAVIRTPDGSSLIHGLLRSDEHGVLSAQAFRGPDAVTTLYMKQIRKAGPGRADTVIAGTTITLDTGVLDPPPPAGAPSGGGLTGTGGGAVTSTAQVAADAALTGTFATKSSAYASGADYVVGQLVTSSGTLYRVTTAHTSGGAINLSNFTAVGGGTSDVGSDNWLKAWAANPNNLLRGGASTFDANGVGLTAALIWPDGTAGTYTATTVTPLGATAWTLTYGSPATKTVTQPAVTRDANGLITSRPAMTVS